MRSLISDRFKGNWRNLDVLLTVFRLGIWFLRGIGRRLFFGRASGLVLIGPAVKIYYPRQLKVGKNFVAERGCEINCLAGRGVMFGDNVTVGSHAIVRPSNIYGGEIGEGLIVGDYSNIGPFSYIGCSGMISIGKNVMISPRVSLYAENHNFERTDLPMKEQGVTRSHITIEDDCWIAANAVILAGVTIGQGTIVAAGSIVTKDVPAHSIVAGNPAKVIRSRTDSHG